MYKSLNQAIIGFFLLALVEGVLSFSVIAQSITKPGYPLKIQVLGAIARPGSYLIAPGAPGICSKTSLRQRYQDSSVESIDQCPTLSKATRVAGGITPEANIRQISIRHLQTNSVNQSINIDLWQFLRFGGLTQA